MKTREQEKKAKYLLRYGAGSKVLQKQLNITREEANGLVNKFHTKKEES